MIRECLSFLRFNNSFSSNPKNHNNNKILPRLSKQRNTIDWNRITRYHHHSSTGYRNCDVSINLYISHVRDESLVSPKLLSSEHLIF
jgi:hypothetical protein